MNKEQALKLIADYGRAASRTCLAMNGRSLRNPREALKDETKHFRKLVKALGITEEITDKEIDNA